MRSTPRKPDRITAEEMRAFAARILKKPRCDVTMKETIAALPALRLHLNGAKPRAVVAEYKKTFQGLIEAPTKKGIT